jgi:hypothetical protein
MARFSFFERYAFSAYERSTNIRSVANIKNEEGIPQYVKKISILHYHGPKPG